MPRRAMRSDSLNDSGVAARSGLHSSRVKVTNRARSACSAAGAPTSLTVGNPRRTGSVAGVFGSGDGWVTVADGSRRWGRYGAAGVLARHVDEHGSSWYF